jgi:hypothetical protein
MSNTNINRNHLSKRNMFNAIVHGVWYSTLHSGLATKDVALSLES